MNRVDFMNQLERLLQNIALAEREEALQYYNDYFDDAGAENEQEVIEALGNPARVAENIKRDLLGNGYGDGLTQSVQASDRALVKYGQLVRTDSRESDDGAAPDQESMNERREYGDSNGAEGRREYGNSNGAEGRREYGGTNGAEGRRGYGGLNDSDERYEYDNLNGSDRRQEYGSENQSWKTASGKNEKHGRMPAWAIAMLATVLLLGSPVIAGVLITVIGILFSVLVVWYALVFAFGVIAISLFLVLAVLVITGILCLFANIWVGMTMIGGGLICGAVGILFLMLTVTMAGSVTPAICKGIASLFRRGKESLRKSVQRFSKRSKCAR